MGKAKTFMVMIVAMFAMSAVAAVSASADDLTAEKYPVTLTGFKDEFEDVFTTAVGTVKCPTPTYHGTLSGPATTVTIVPNYTDPGCTGFGFPATIHTNGCHYLFHVNGAGSTEGDITVQCPEKQEITITAIGAGTTKCTVHVPPQTTKGSVKYTNIGEGTTREITVHVELVELTYSSTKGTGLGACPDTHRTDGSLKAKARLTAEEEVSPFAHVGLFLS
jgi:hypothetical protein